jgi:hypothetical protein
MSLVKRMRFTEASAAHRANRPNSRKRHIFVTYQYLTIFFADYLGDSLRPALVADPPYSKASNQQSYQQLLWKSLLLVKIVRFFLVCAFELLPAKTFSSKG